MDVGRILCREFQGVSASKQRQTSKFQKMVQLHSFNNTGLFQPSVHQTKTMSLNDDINMHYHNYKYCQSSLHIKQKVHQLNMYQCLDLKK